MIALIQRVKRARVTVEGTEAGAIGEGLLILLGVHTTDSSELVPWLARKCVHLRVFPDEQERMNRLVIDHGGTILVVSQFTLYGNAMKGNRPSFVESAAADLAEPLYRMFCDDVSGHLGYRIETGKFGAMMDVELTNWGPVTLSLEKRN